MKSQLLILVPVYNEWPHLLSVLEDLRTRFSDILVIDDGSSDKSFLLELKIHGFEYLSFPFNLGHWGAIQAGFRYALARGYEGTVTFDGDGQHLAGEALKIVPFLGKGYDLVIGSDSNRGNFAKKSCWLVLDKLSGIRVNDFTSGLRAYSRKAMQELIQWDFMSLHYQDLGVLFLARKRGLEILEIPVEMRSRTSETSRVFPTVTSLLKYLVITLTFILVRKP